MQREAVREQDDARQRRKRAAATAKREMERHEKLEARRSRQQEAMAEKMEEARLKAEADAQREAARAERLEEARRVRHEQSLAQREKARARVEAAMSAHAAMTARQRHFYAHRMELEEQRRALFAEQRRLQRDARAQASQGRLEAIANTQSRVEERLERRRCAAPCGRRQTRALARTVVEIS